MSVQPPPDDVLISHGSPKQLADALASKLSPTLDLRTTREEFSENELDHVHSSLSAASISLSSLRNAFAPVSSLPRETLAMIFAMVASLYTSGPSSFLSDPRESSEEEPSHAWISITHVCRHWRETAFAFPMLWTDIDTSCTLASLAFLDRAHQSPLRVHLRDAITLHKIKPSLEQGRLLQMIAAHSEQFIELHVQPTFRYSPAILRHFDKPAPQLKMLSIALGFSQDQDKVLPLLFAGQTPKLSHLTLFDFAKWSESWPLGDSLTHLCLYDQHIRARLPISDFVTLLAGCTRLEELIIVEAGPSPVYQQGVPPAVGLASRGPAGVILDMSRLHLLHIGNWGSARLVSEFMEHLIVPHTARVEIWADVLFHGSETLTYLLPSDLSNIHPLHDLKAIHLMYRPSLRDSPQLFSISDGVLVIHFYFIANTSGQLLASVFSVLDTHAIEELTVGVDCDPDFAHAWWRATLKPMKKLSKLNIIRRRSRAILKALSNDDEDRHPGVSDKYDEIPCPALSSLVITDDSALASIRLYALAQDRASLGIPIHSLAIVNATPGLNYHAQDEKLGEEMEDLRCHIEEVRFARDDKQIMPDLPVGWPSEPFLWTMRRKNGKGWPNRAA